MMAPAFKEWRVIVEALGAGEQVLILRKGGISEGKAGFQPNCDRFWLFPTAFHEQLEKTKPAAARGYTPGEAALSGPDSTVPLRYFANLVKAEFLTDWERISALDAHHFWTSQTVRERYAWKKPHGLHALVIRVHRLTTPIALAVTEQMAGCKSWIEVPYAFDAMPSTPVLDDPTFARRVAELPLV